MKSWVYSLMLCIVTSAAAELSEAEKAHLAQRIRAADPNAMLEAGISGDPALISPLEELLQSRSDSVTEDLRALAHSGFRYPRREDLMDREYDMACQNARMALAKLGVKKYLDEIMTELTTPTNSTLFKIIYGTGDPEQGVYKIQVRALGKLAYINNPSTTRVIAEFLQYTESPNVSHPHDYVRPALAIFAAQTLRKMVDNPPATDDAFAWQRWWQQNKDKYP